MTAAALSNDSCFPCSHLHYIPTTATPRERRYPQCEHVGSQTRETIVQRVVDREHLVKVHGDAGGLVAETQVARDSDTVLADHGDDRAAVVLLDRLGH